MELGVFFFKVFNIILLEKRKVFGEGLFYLSVFSLFDFRFFLFFTDFFFLYVVSWESSYIRVLKVVGIFYKCSVLFEGRGGICKFRVLS